MAMYERNPSTGELTDLVGGPSLNNIVSSSTKETTTTATKVHSEGDYFDLGGVFVKAKTDISVGDSLVEDTNYEVTNVGAELKSLQGSSGSTILNSYVGMIIHSYTLDTMAKVIEIYGGTTWVRMTNTFLRDANGSAGSTGGNNNVTLSESNLPSHSHAINFYTGYGVQGFSSAATGSNTEYPQYNKNYTMHTSSTGSGTSFSVLNAYTTVYIWRRTA